MTYAAAMLGDLHINLVTRYPTSMEDLDKSTYILSFHDVVTGEREELSYTSENEAICTFASILLADEGDGAHRGYVENVRARLTGKKWLP